MTNPKQPETGLVEYPVTGLKEKLQEGTGNLEEIKEKNKHKKELIKLFTEFCEKAIANIFTPQFFAFLIVLILATCVPIFLYKAKDKGSFAELCGPVVAVISAYIGYAIGNKKQEG